MDSVLPWPLLAHGVALAIPLTFGLAAALPTRFAPIHRAKIATSVALALAVCAVTLHASCALFGSHDPATPGDSFTSLGIRLDAVTSVMLVLVTTIALVLGRYSETYLDGDPGHARYTRWLLATLASVTGVVLANDLLFLAAAWMATSLALHQLLTFYGDRRPALVAAHKKFLVTRLADACLVLGIVLVALEVGSLELDAIDAWAGARASLPASLHVATVLFVAAACLKSAQLPFHGWLTQVMEAPTPVSALLHAGVVNLGGFLMIRLAPLMALAPVAQTLLVVAGMTTAVVASLVMTTRVSVKVALAWSTCAQMGLMLVECGLGAWHLALLHLVAHSLYKAHAFLASGDTVDAWRVESLAARRVPVPLARTWSTATLVLVATTVAALALHASSALELGGTTVLVMLLLAFALAPILAGSSTASPVRIVMRCAAVVVVYLAAHAAFARLVPASGGTWLGAVVVAVGLTTLFALQVALQANPHGRLARSVHPMLFAGFYLDEAFTRLAFQMWPPVLPDASPRSQARVATQEA